MNRTEKTSLSLLGLFLALCLRGQATTLNSTLDPNSTPGNFYGLLYLSFNASNDFTQWSSQPIGLGIWANAGAQTNYTLSGAQLSLGLSLIPQSHNEYDLYSSVSFSDSRVGNPSYNLGSPIVSPGYFVPGQPVIDYMNFSSGNVSLYDYAAVGPPVGTINFSYSLPVNFDGTAGTGVGSWSLIYTVAPTPEPAVGGLMVLGGFGLWWARARRRR